MCVCACVRVRAGDSVNAKVLFFSVCQFHFALYGYVCVVMHYYAVDFCVSICAFRALVSLNSKELRVAERAL